MERDVHPSLVDLFGPGRVLIVLVCALAVVVLLMGRGLLLAPKARLVRRDLLTQAESRFLQQLLRAFPNMLVMAQVSMGALLKPRPGLDRGAWWRAYNGIAQKRVDFAICRPDGSVLVLIELDDSTHDRRADAYRDAVLAQGHYKVVRFPNRPWPTVETIRAKVNEALATGQGR